VNPAWRHRLALATALIVGAVCAAAAVDANAGVSAGDRAFVAKVSQGGMFEVAAGGLAVVRGASQDIRDLGNTERHDHMLVGNELVSIVTPLGIPHATELNAAFSQKLASLKALSGVAFDRAFVAAMDDIHEKDGAAFAAEAAGGTNPALRAFAKETHRIVERHLGALHALVS